MGKPKDKIWQYFIKKNDNSVECKFCQKKYKFPNVTKMKKHISGCEKCPDDARAIMKQKETLNSKDSSEKEPSSLIQQENPRPSTSKSNSMVNFVDKMNDEENVRMRNFRF